VHKIHTTRSCRGQCRVNFKLPKNISSQQPDLQPGISFKTQALYVAVFVSRYLDLFFRWVSFYNFVMKIFFIASSCYILYIMKFRFRSATSFLQCPITSLMSLPLHSSSPTHDPAIDTFRAEFLVGPSLLLALIFHYEFTLSEILWSFSVFLESIAILPQLFMLQRTGEAETITAHYLAALGAYRAFYIPNWIYRCVSPLPH